MISAALPAAVAVYSSAAELPGDVLQLLARHEEATLQFSHAWWSNLEAQVFSRHPGCAYFVLRAEGKAIAVLPLLFSGGPLHRQAVALANYYSCLYEPALAPGTSAEAVARLFMAVRSHLGTIHSLRLAPMNPEGQAFEVVERALALAGFSTQRYFCFGNWYLQAPTSWAVYLASRDGKLRSTIKRMKQRLAADKGHVEIITDLANLERGVSAYEAVYARSWKVPEPSTGFMPGLMRLCAERGAMRLGLVWLNGQPIAAQFWIVAHGRAEIYKVAYDEAFKSHSPGTVLTAHLLQHVLEEDLAHEVDYLIGDDPYKKNWMSHRRERWGLVARNRRSWLGFSLWLADTAKSLLKPIVQRLRTVATRTSHPNEGPRQTA